MEATPRPHEDHRYVDALLQNDRGLIREIYARFADRIEAFVRSNGGNSGDARDLFQEALVNIYQRARRGDFVLTCPFEAYLFIICRNKWLNELKRRQREGVTIREIEGSEEKEAAVFPAADTERAAGRERLFREKFDELSDRCRELLRLSWQGTGMEELAGRLGVSYGYARKKKSECIARLMELIQAAPEYRGLV